MTLQIRVPVTTYKKFDIDKEDFKSYIKEVRIFISNYSTHDAEFIQLMRKSGDIFVTECQTLPLDLVPDWQDKICNLKEWFDENYEMVYDYLVENNKEFY